jgi:indole-3-glycerol phosphate synthase
VAVTDARRLSQAISEGDGISVIVHVDGPEEAARAEEQGAEAVALVHPVEGVNAATGLPVLWLGRPGDAAAIEGCGAHAVTAWVASGVDELRELHDALDEEMELVVGVANEEELEQALELDTEIFLISAREADGGEHPLERVIDLLPDVPAGKLAIAQVDARSRDEVDALERAGFDAVLVPAGHVGELVGGALPEV